MSFAFASTSRLVGSSAGRVAIRAPASFRRSLAFAPAFAVRDASSSASSSSSSRLAALVAVPRRSVLVQPHAASLLPASRRFASSVPSTAAAKPAPASSSPGQQQQQRAEEEEAGEEDPEPEPRSFRERMRFLWKRYGWWALGVYQLASIVDISITFAAIHMLGAEHIRSLETRVREWAGFGKREMDDDEVAAWPVPIEVPESAPSNNAEATHEAKRVIRGEKSKKESSGGNSALWAEAVLAYTIHKTLLLPFRVMLTAAVTPSFVKQMVRLGWAKPNNLVKVKKAAKAAK
jgi:hypothetical protein